MSEPIKPSGPELTQGVAFLDVPEGGILVGQAKGEPVLLVKAGGEVHAIGAACAHYGAPLADGIVVGHEIRCPWHHARFDVRTGEDVSPPALRGIDSWDVVREGDRVRVTGKRGGRPASVVIVGTGAAADGAAEMLRRLGYTGDITMIGKDGDPPVDRPNLSKDFITGAPAEWLPLRSPEFFAEKKITLLAGVEVTKVDPAAHQVKLSDGRTLGYGALLLATGAAPIRLELPGANLPHVSLLRTVADSRAIIARAAKGKRAVVIGSSFIGLEVAASLRKLEVEVHVVAPEAIPLEKVLGKELGLFVRALHEEHGVKFQLGRKPASITEKEVVLDDGTRLAADFVVMGVGVRPLTKLAEDAGLKVDRGVLVDAKLKTSAPDIYAAGDIARFPSKQGATVRIEHWTVAQHQGQVAARNMLGKNEAYRAVPFFWSQHYDVPINYVGHAEAYDGITIGGSIKDRNCMVAYREKGRIVAMASIYRDRDSLLAEDALARDDQAALETLCKA